MFAKRTAPATSPAPLHVAPTGPASDDGWLDGFADTRARGGGSYFAPGQYIVQVQAIQRLLGTKPEIKNHNLIIPEFKIIETILAYEADPAPPNGFPPSNREGELVSMVLNTTLREKTAWSDIKGLLLAIARCDSPDIAESDISPAEWNEALKGAVEAPGTKYKGYLLRANAVKTFTKDRKNFTRVTFSAHSAPLE